jgi:hypothetical protein
LVFDNNVVSRVKCSQKLTFFCGHHLKCLDPCRNCICNFDEWALEIKNKSRCNILLSKNRIYIDGSTSVWEYVKGLAN